MNQEIQFIPITALSPFSSGGHVQTIRARVSEKGDLRVFTKKADGTQGKLFSCVLNDETSSIRATFFNEAADANHAILNNTEVYYFTNFAVKTANKSFNNTNNDYEITFDGRSTILRARNESTIPNSRYNFSLITVLPHKPKNSNVDVLGVVLEVGSVETIESKAKGTTLTKRTALIAEPSGSAVEICFWGDDCSQCDNWNIGNVVALKGVRVSDWNTCSLTWGRNSAGTVDPAQMSDVQKYSAWFRSNGINTSNVNSVSKRNAPGGATGDETDKNNGKFTFHGRQFLSYIDTEQLGTVIERTDFLDCVVFVSRFSKSTDGTYWYISCPKCQKKVTPTDEYKHLFHCNKCGVDYPEQDTIPRYIFQAEVNDRITSKWVTFFDDGGRQFFGKPARQLKDDMEAAIASAAGQQSQQHFGSQSPEGGDERQNKGGADIAKMLNKYLNAPFLAKIRCIFEKGMARAGAEGGGMMDEEVHRTKVVIADCVPLKKDINRPQLINAKYADERLPPGQEGTVAGLLLVDEIDGLFHMLSDNQHE